MPSPKSAIGTAVCVYKVQMARNEINVLSQLHGQTKRLLVNMTVSDPVTQFLAFFYRARPLITVLARIRHWTSPKIR